MSGPSPAVAPGSRQSRDRSLFDAAARGLCRKDLAPASRRARRQRLERTVRWAPLSETTRLLDVGCGAGFSATYLRGRYGTYIGIDHSEKLIELARRHNAGPGVEFHAIDAEAFRPEERFDVVLLIGVLHHLERPAEVMARLVDLLAPGGAVVANEPQPANPLIRAARAARKRLEADYSDEQEELSAAQLRDLFEGAGLTNVRLVPQGLFSTPFAEVVLRPAALARLLVGPACAADRLLEDALRPLMRLASWNLVAVGRRHEDGA